MDNPVFEVPEEPVPTETPIVVSNTLSDRLNLPSPSKFDPAKDFSENQKIDFKLGEYYKSLGYANIPDGVSFDRFRLLANHLQYLGEDGEWKYLTKKTNSNLFVKPATSGLKASDKQYLGMGRVLTSVPEDIEMTILDGDQLKESPLVMETNVDGVTTEMTNSLDRVQEIAKNLRLPEREIRGLDQMAQTIRGGISIQEAKLVNVEKAIDLEKRKQIPDSTKLESLESQKTAIIESLNALRGDLNGQITTIKETINKIKDDRLTLRERIRLILREQGFTIGALLTIVGLVIGLIASEANKVIAGGGNSSSNSGSNGSDDNFVKKSLKNLAAALRSLAEKVVTALPGVIGSLVSALLKSGAAVVTMLAEHLWALAIGIGIMIYSHFARNTEIGRRIHGKRK